MNLTNMRSVVYAALLTGVVGFSSCEKMLRDMATRKTASEQAAQADTAAAVTGTAAAPARPKEPEYELTFSGKTAIYKDLAQPAGEKENPFTRIGRIAEQYAEDPNWADKHADINGVLLQNEGKPYYSILQQQAANEMLRHELFPHYYQDQNNAKMLEAVAFYTRHLIEAKSEDAELMYKCLRALQGFWTSEEIAQAAQVTAARVKARPVTSAADTTTRNGSYRQIYARELKKLAQRVTEGS